MTGELKDASPWCTEIRLITERADSLIANWDKVNCYSYEYNYLTWWYLKRSAQYYNYSSSSGYRLEQTEKLKDTYEEVNELLTQNKEDIHSYFITHKYTIYNPLFKMRVPITDYLYFDKDMQLLRKADSDIDIKGLLGE